MEIDFEQLVNAFVTVLTGYGLRVLGGVLILIGGWIVSGWVARRVRRWADKSEKMDDTLKPLLIKIARLAVLAITFVAVLNNFGIQTTSIIAVLGAMGLAVGLALQGTLSNVASGIVLLVLRPFEVDDFIEVGGTMGTAIEIGLFATELKQTNGVIVTMPNGQVWGSRISNFSRNGIRRAEIDIGISYSDDIGKAFAACLDVVGNEARVLEEPAPNVIVVDLGDNSVDLRVFAWTQSSDCFATSNDLRRALKERMDLEGISIPFPQRDLHIVSNDAGLFKTG